MRRYADPLLLVFVAGSSLVLTASPAKALLIKIGKKSHVLEIAPDTGTIVWCGHSAERARIRSTVTFEVVSQRLSGGNTWISESSLASVFTRALMELRKAKSGPLADLPRIVYTADGLRYRRGALWMTIRAGGVYAMPS